MHRHGQPYVTRLLLYPTSTFPSMYTFAGTDVVDTSFSLSRLTMYNKLDTVTKSV